MPASPQVARNRNLGCALLCCWWTCALAAPDPYPQVARSYLLTKDDQLLWQHDASARLPVASLAKLLTALVLLDDKWSNDRWMTVSSTAARAAPTRIGLRDGEQVRAGAALAAMLIRSANDACMVLVENVTSTRQQFVARMNQYAATLKLQNSHFVDPCGFDAPDQYSTVMDLLKIAQAAQQHPLIAALVANSRASLTTKAGRHISFTSTNQLLDRLPGTIGMKTGYTEQAGQCLIARVRRDGHEVLLVMLGGRQRWWQAHKMIEDAFASTSSTP